MRDGVVEPDFEVEAEVAPAQAGRRVVRAGVGNCEMQDWSRQLSYRASWMKVRQGEKKLGHWRRHLL
jgi:hypothetical protein